MRVVITLSGQGQRFLEAGYKKIKPLIEVDGKPIIEHLVEKFPSKWLKTFICNDEQYKSEELITTLNKIAPGSKIVAIPKHFKGPVWSVLEAMKLMPDSISDSEPLIVNYCDFSFEWSSEEFENFVAQTDCDGAVVCYTGFHPSYIRPNLYAYCKVDGSKVLEIKEKGHFTQDRTQEYASSGTYYFKSGKIIKKYFNVAMQSEHLINGEAFVSLAYMPMLKDGLDIRVFEIKWFLQWGTPEDLKDYQYWSNFFKVTPPVHFINLCIKKGLDVKLLKTREFDYWYNYFTFKQMREA
ncbi:MAG: NTP transferase domain-containing protein [Oligoflexia bacterium]|nr:NTP transferase domain-containing protein [Oligoflexia bacterium]